MKIRFSYIIAISAFLVAGCAAYFSVFGLSQLFAGASVAVIIMASSLELAKIVSVSMLQRYWNKTGKGLRIYLMIGIFVLVCVTSAGIYGFLSNAYQKTASKFQISENEISVLTNKKAVFDNDIANTKTIIASKTKRVEQLSNLRTNQETRLDSAKNNTNRVRARNDIADATAEIKVLNKDIDSLNAKNSILSDSANSYSTKAIDSKSKSTSTSEIGPLKYLAALTGYPMDKVVNWFILLLIFVFDPLAVALVFSFNRVLQIEREAELPSPKIKELVTEPTISEVSVTEPKTTALKLGEGLKIPEYKPFAEPVIINESSEPIGVITEPEPEIDVQEPSEPEDVSEPLPEAIIPIEAPDDRFIAKSVPVVETPAVVTPIEAPDARFVTRTETDSMNDAINALTRTEPIIPNGKVELNDIKEMRENRFTDNSNNTIERIGTPDRTYKRK